MAVQSDTSRIQYAGNNSTTTSYAVPFVFQENSHLKAIARTSAGVESVVTLTNHTGAGNVNGGTVRTAVAVPATSTLTIYREVPATQTTTYAEGGDFPAASHERALDKLTQIAQQLKRGVESSVRLSEATPINPTPVPSSATPHVLTTVNGGAPTWETVPSVSFPNSLNALTDATTVNAADELIIQQGGITKRATATELFSSTAINTGIKAQLGLNVQGNNFEFATNGAVIHRLQDRVFIGGATQDAATFPVTTTDWYNTFQKTRVYGDRIVGAANSASTTSGSPTVTFTAGANAPTAGQRVFGNGIPENATILSVDSATQITLSANATATTSGGTLVSADPTQFFDGAAVGALRVLPTSGNPPTSLDGAISGFFASRSDSFPNANPSAIGIQTNAVNDNATHATGAFGLYIEAHQESNVAGQGTYGTEIEVSSVRSSEIKATPFNQGLTVGIQLGSGCGLAGAFGGKTQVNCSAAMQIVANPTRWRSGIVFLNRSIEGTDGYTGSGTAIAMSGGHMIEWYNASSQVAGRIFASANLSASDACEFRFTSLGIQCFSKGQVSGYIFNPSGTMANWWVLAGSETGTPVKLQASGADTNVDLFIETKGTGALRFGTHAAVTTETVTGFITIKDAAGNTRKLAVVS